MTDTDTILITGGAGFIGANLINRLLKSHTTIHVFMRKETNLWRIRPFLPQITLHTVDLLDKASVAKLVRKIHPTTIFHFAAYGGYHYEGDIQNMIDINIQSTVNLLLATQDVAYTSFINTGSSSEYGFKNSPMKETDLLEPNSFYAATKASATHLCQVFAKQYDKPIVTIRPFSVYGPYEEPGRFVPHIMQAVLSKTPIAVTNGIARRDFIYISDVIDGYMLAMKKPKKITGEIFNMGTGKEYSNDEVVKALLAISKTKIPVQKGAYAQRVWDATHWKADTHHAEKILGWKPKHSLEQGLTKTFQWFEKNMNLYQQ